jgi:hypothetical protein
MCRGEPIYKPTQIIAFYLIFEPEDFTDRGRFQTVLSPPPPCTVNVTGHPYVDCYYKAGGRGQH